MIRPNSTSPIDNIPHQNISPHLLDSIKPLRKILFHDYLYLVYCCLHKMGAVSDIGILEGIDVKKTDSFGLDLATTLAEYQLDGEITLDRSEGTAFTISFKEVK